MSDLKYVLADDGELYPVADKSINKEITTVAECQIEISKSDLIPTMKRPDDVLDDERKMKKIGLFKRYAVSVSDFMEDYFFIYLLLSLCGSAILSAYINAVAYHFSFATDNVFQNPEFILSHIFTTLLATTVLIAVPSEISKLGKRYENYGLKQNNVWVVDFKSDEVKRAVITGVDEPCIKMTTTTFVVQVNFRKNPKYIKGRDIYFTENDAKRVLLYVRNHNERQLSLYYPDWMKDEEFTKFYHNRIYDSCKYELDCSENRVYITKPQKFIKEYIKLKKKAIEQRKKEEAEACELKRQLEEMKNSPMGN